MKRGLWLPLVLCLAFWTGIGYAAISSVDFSDPAVKTEMRIDSFRVLPATETIDVPLKKVYLDDKDAVIREETGIDRRQIMNIPDNPETPENEEALNYTALQTEIDALMNAIEESLK